MSKSIDISFIITVFNKERQLTAMINSILRQTGNINCEYIFVDDASTDASIEMIKKNCAKLPNVIIVANTQNKGPAIRLNQGGLIASGRYFFLIDSDDILAKNALQIMLKTIKKAKADFVFGGQKKTNQTQTELLEIKLLDDITYEASANPLDTILAGKYVRMSYLTTRDVFLKAGGTDERVFIQDETLPLRLAYNASTMATLSVPAVYAAKEDDSLSQNKLQQMHDRFYAYYFALAEFENLSAKQKKLIYQRAVSSIWKAKKQTGNIGEKISFFIFYLSVKLSPRAVKIENLDHYKNFMSSLKNVRTTI